MNFNRRSFLKTATATAAGLSIPAIVSAGMSSEKKKKKEAFSLFETNDTVLMQGDSITDAGRDRSVLISNHPSGMGNGYAFVTAAKMMHSLPAKNLKFYNRGISGNKVYQLSDRWQLDCLSLNPNVLSILVGVNDYWHKKKHGYEGTIETYENDYRSLLRTTKSFLPDVKLVIGEPFALKDCSAVDESWFPEFDAYRAVARKIAEEMEAVFVPYHDVFTEAQKHASSSYWTFDGVHPTIAGCELMAEAWVQAVR